MRTFNLQYTTISMFCLFAIVGCETVIDYDDSNFQPQLVINSHFAPDSIWEVHVSHTKSRFDGSTDLGVENANIVIQDITSNFEFDLHHVGNGVYQTSHNPQSNHVYHIIVDDEELGTSQAIGKVPSVEHIEVTSSLIQNQNSQYLNIEVNSSEVNNSGTYFAWQLVNLDDTDIGEGGELTTSNPDNGFSVVDTRDSTTQDLIFVDGNELYDTTVVYSIPSDVINEVINNEDISEVKNNAVIKLVAISKELYEYYHNQEQQLQETSNSSHTQDFYTNVKNGVGIFAGYKEVYIML